MPKFSQIPQNSSPADADAVVGVTSAGVDSRFSFGVILNWLKAKTAWIKASNIDFATFDDVAKYGENASNLTITSGTPKVIASVSITVTRTTKVLVIGQLTASTTADTEFSPYIYLDDVRILKGPNGAVNNVGGERYLGRAVAAIATLTPGTHTIDFRLGGSAGTITVQATRGQIVTSLGSMLNS